MLSYERREIARYGLSLGRLRLFILRFVQNRSLKKASGALFLTEYAANTICTWTGPIAKFKVIPHGVGSDFKNAQQKLTWPNGNERPIRCLYVSNTAMYKHQWNVVRAIKELRDEGYNVNITLAGGGRGPAQRKLEETIKEIDPDSIFSKQKKFIPYDKLPELLTNADIFIFASSCENMPNTLVEAMAVGLPIASSILGPMPEVLKDGGTYFDPENSSSIANAVKELIGNDLHRINLAMRAKQLSKQYSWKRCASETMSFLVEVFLDYQRKSNV
jgi:glycosyltransferase involved in cell wall biosynthesis